jgi:ketosteroid isomerase-like protein
MTEDDVRRFFAALSSGDMEPLAECLDEQVVLHFPGRRFGGTFTGRRRVTVFLKQNQRLFRGGLQFEVHWAGVTGDRAVACWSNHGVTRSGKEYSNRGTTIFVVDDNQIVEIHDYLDTELIAETWPAKS